MDQAWRPVLQHPMRGDHIVQLYQDEAFLAQAVAEYVGGALRGGEAALVVATAAHREPFLRALGAAGHAPEEPLARGQLRLLDAHDTLERLMLAGTPDWMAFHEVLGGAVAEARLAYPGVRLYGEMVDVLWQRGAREAAHRLEEFWNRLGKLQTFSLFCAYRMDSFDAAVYGGPLECVCSTHTHLIPASDYARFDAAITEASGKVLEQPLARMLLSLAASNRPGTDMPLGQAVLLWLRKNMPRTAEKVLAEARARYAGAS